MQKYTLKKLDRRGNINHNSDGFFGGWYTIHNDRGDPLDVRIIDFWLGLAKSVEGISRSLRRSNRILES
jgi:hypothetical protein